MLPEASRGTRPCGQGDRLVHRLEGHVVEHDHVGAGRQGLADLEEAGRLDLDPEPGAGLGTGAAHGLGDVADEVEVVVLDQDHVGQADAVVRAAPELHGVLLEEAQAGRRLARVEDLGLGAGDGVDDSAA